LNETAGSGTGAARAAFAPQVFAQRDAEITRQLDLLLRVFTPRTVFMEIGSPDCELALRAATYVERVWCIEAPRGVARGLRPPCNLRLLRSGGLAAMAAQSIDVAFSETLKRPEEVHRALVPGGVYFVYGALLPAQLMRKAGFSRVVYYAGKLRVPAALARISRSTTTAAFK
jgi:hypothetical protein